MNRPIYRYQTELGEHSELVKVAMRAHEPAITDGVDLRDRDAHPAAGGWNPAIRDVQSSGVSALEDHFSACAITRCEDIADGALVVW